MATRCKFVCMFAQGVESTVWNDGKPEKGTLYRYEFQVVYSGSPENEQFFASTPGGTLTFYSVRNQAFETGKEYYLDITPAGA